MSVAAATREAVRKHPFLEAALRAGVLNYTAAARFLDAEGDTDAVAAALRRYREELPEYAPESKRVSVSMRSGVARVTDGSSDDALLSIAGTEFVPSGGESTAIVASGEIDPEALVGVLGRLRIDDTDVEAAAVDDGTLIVVVGRRSGAAAVRTIEDELAGR
ncbi:MAG: hypothetical protein PPP58_05335 [Natronomonas sp.]